MERRAVSGSIRSACVCTAKNPKCAEFCLFLVKTTEKSFHPYSAAEI